MSSVLHDTLIKCRPTLKWSETIRRWYPERNSAQFCNEAKAKFCICGPQKVGICTLLQTFWGSGPLYHLKLLWRAAKHLMKTYNSSHLQKMHKYIDVQLLVGLLNICYCYCCIPLCPTGSKSGVHCTAVGWNGGPIPSNCAAHLQSCIAYEVSCYPANGLVAAVSSFHVLTCLLSI